MNKERLLNVAKALRESPDPDAFDMEVYRHGCGTPACAFGHYVYRRDLQKEFEFPLKEGLFMVSYLDPRVLRHFDISDEQASQLFDGGSVTDCTCDDVYVGSIQNPYCPNCGEYAGFPSGCGNAKTANEAADWIEKFVANDGVMP